MNEKPEGTPNPLNPVQNENPVGQEPVPEVEQPTPVEPVTPVEQQAEQVAAPVEEVAPVEETAAVEEVATVEEVTPVEEATPADNTTPVEEVAPTEEVAPVEEAVLSETSTEQVVETPESPAPEPTPAEAPVSEPEEPVVDTPQESQAVLEDNTEPAAVETTEQVTVEELAPEGMSIKSNQKSKKPFLVVAIILLLVAIVTGVAAAIIMLKPFGKDDTVPAAIAKLLGGNTPKYISMNGTVNVSSTSNTSSFNTLDLSFVGGVNKINQKSFASASITAALQGGSKFSFDADEIQTSNGGLYLKLSNVYRELVQHYYDDDTIIVDDANYYLESGEQTNCLDGDEETNCMPTYEVTDCIGSEDEDSCIYTEPLILEPTTEPGLTETLFDYLGVFDVIDDEWIYIPQSSFSNLSDVTALDMPTQCLIDATGKLSQYGDNLLSRYQQYPFINYSTDNLGITKKNDTLYRLTIDADNLAMFINSLGNSGFMNELLACTGGDAINKNVSGSDLSTIISALPAIYVEIDGNHDFTRVYLKATTPDGATTATADISLSYPSNLTIDEPDNYIDINQVLSKLLSEFYNQPVVQE